MLPVVLLAPWLNSIEFDNTYQVVEKSVGSIPIIVDLDRYFVSSSDLPSRQFFRKLVDPEVGPLIWMELVESHVNYIPCIQMLGVSRTLISKQIEIATALNRGFVFRIELERGYNSEEICDIVSECADKDFLIIIDYGYSDNATISEFLVTSFAEKLLAISENFKFVVSGSSFPNEFSDFDDFSQSKTINSRVVYENLSKKYGNYSFFYGDWSSTKSLIRN